MCTNMKCNMDNKNYTIFATKDYQNMLILTGTFCLVFFGRNSYVH